MKERFSPELKMPVLTPDDAKNYAENGGQNIDKEETGIFDENGKVKKIDSRENKPDEINWGILDLEHNKEIREEIENNLPDEIPEKLQDTFEEMLNPKNIDTFEKNTPEVTTEQKETIFNDTESKETSLNEDLLKEKNISEGKKSWWQNFNQWSKETGVAIASGVKKVVGVSLWSIGALVAGAIGFVGWFFYESWKIIKKEMGWGKKDDKKKDNKKTDTKKGK